MKKFLIVTIWGLLLGLVPGLSLSGSLSTGLVAHFPFDGDLDDESGNQVSAFTMGGVGFGEGFLNQAAVFDGIDDQIVFDLAGSNVFDNDAFSIAFVFQLDCSVGCSIISKRDACRFGDFFDVRGSDTGVVFEVSNTNGNFVVRADTLENEFNYFAAVQDAALIRIFMNGQFIEELATDSLDLLSSVGDFGLSVSPCVGFDGTVPLKGKIDELRVYDRALTEIEVDQLFTGLLFANGFENAGTPSQPLMDARAR